jgi:hypothetical protein
MCCFYPLNAVDYPFELFAFARGDCERECVCHKVRLSAESLFRVGPLFRTLNLLGHVDACRRPFLSQRRPLRPLPQWPTLLLMEEQKPLLRDEQQPHLTMGLVDALLAPHSHRLYTSWVHAPCCDWR